MTRKLLLIGAIAAMSLPAAAEAQGRGRNADGVPPGHRPPPGMCRVWIDGVPPGRQPAPTSCREAVRNRPSNARVIYGDDANGYSQGKAKGKYKSKHKKGDDRRDDRYAGRRDRDDDRSERERVEERRGGILDRIEQNRRDSSTARPTGDTVKREKIGGVVVCTDSQGRTRVCS